MGNDFSSILFGNDSSKQFVTFDDLLDSQFIHDNILISTFPATEQKCLIRGTVDYQKEADIINGMIRGTFTKKRVVIYGRNWLDITPIKKKEQLQNLNVNCAIYSGGLFEWLCMREIVGGDENNYDDNDFGIDGDSTAIDLMDIRPSHFSLK